MIPLFLSRQRRRARALEQLDATLVRLEAALHLPACLGLMTAIHTAPSPEAATPSRWISAILGDAEFNDVTDASSVLGQLVTEFGNVGEALRTRRNLGPPTHDEDVIRQWCEGYLLGARMDDAWLDDEIGESNLQPLEQLAGEHGELDDDILDGLAHDLPAIVLWLHDHFAEARHAGARALDDSPPQSHKPHEDAP